MEENTSFLQGLKERASMMAGAAVACVAVGGAAIIATNNSEPHKPHPVTVIRGQIEKESADACDANNCNAETKKKHMFVADSYMRNMQKMSAELREEREIGMGYLPTKEDAEFGAKAARAKIVELHEKEVGE